MKEKITSIVKQSLEELNNTLSKKLEFDNENNIVLYGKNGALDSLALVSLIVAIEGYIEEQLNVSLILANEKAMSQRNSPFATINSLTNYIDELISQEINHV
jgi:D-alanine--poly(phosphoribitol) ligase subunit 2